MSAEPDHEILKDPIYGYIKLYEHEKQIVDTPVFQRLRRTKQLSVVDYVYPGAVHTRFSHSLGVMHVAGVFTQQLLGRAEGISTGEQERCYYLMRLWGLVHDIGHGPFSHLFDEEILATQNSTHEIKGSEIVEQHPDISRVRLPAGITVELLSDMMQSMEEWPLNGPIGTGDVTEQILSYVATGHYSADIIDYLLRDSLFTGAGYGAVDWSRLIALSYPQGNRVALDSRAEDAFDSFLLARLFMFTTVYYHRTVRAFYQIARRYLRELKDQGFFKQYLDTIEGYSSLDEGLLYSEMARTRSKLGLMLLDRKNPYSKFEEARLGISDPLVARFLDGPFMKGLVLDAMRGKWTDPPEEAFFVDTPKIALNPITRPMQDKTVLFKKSDGTVEERDVWNTRWGKLSEQMGVVRLYIHDDFSQYRELLKGAFHGTIGSAGTFV